VTIKNPTVMPVSWRLVGFETLGEEFSCQDLEGCVMPYSTVTVSLSFQPTRPLVLNKKFVKIEASLLSVICIGIEV